MSASQQRQAGRLPFKPLLLAFLFLCLISTILSAQGIAPVLIIEIDGAITPAKKEFLSSALEKAQSRKAQLLVVKLNTPGGLLSSMQEMVSDLLEAPVPTVVYVAPSGGGAISAGVFITLAGHFAYMAPGTTIGAAHPVSGGGKNLQGDMRLKVENFAASLVRAVAEKRGRNAEWAEKAVRESVAITAEEALQEQVIDGLAASIDKLLLELDGKIATIDGIPVALQSPQEAPRQAISMSWRQRTIDLLCDPNIALLFGFFAMLFIWIELYTPGGFIAGSIGTVCLVLSLIAGQTLPFTEGGILLLVFAFGFFVAEAFIPAFGFWGIAGIVCLILGSVYLVDTEQVWSAEGFEVSNILIGTAASLMLLIMLSIAYAVFRSKGIDLGKKRPELIGKSAQVQSAFQGAAHTYGKIIIGGKVFSAEFSQFDERIPLPGEEVRVVEITNDRKSVIVVPAN